MAFTMSIDDFVISFFTTGNGVTNLAIEIYSMTRRGLTPEINALSTLMFASVLILLLLWYTLNIGYRVFIGKDLILCTRLLVIVPVI